MGGQLEGSRTSSPKVPITTVIVESEASVAAVIDLSTCGTVHANPAGIERDSVTAQSKLRPGKSRERNKYDTYEDV